MQFFKIVFADNSFNPLKKLPLTGTSSLSHKNAEEQANVLILRSLIVKCIGTLASNAFYS